jgi:hypothetical protein
MRKIVLSCFFSAALGLPLCLGVTGCDSDNAGGNESGVMEKTEGGKGVTPPDSPATPEDYYSKHKAGKKK